MDHSYSRFVSLTCLRCGQTFTAEIWLIVDASARPDLVERIRAETLHALTCPHCGHAGQVDAPLLLYFSGSPLPLGEEPGVRILFSPAQRTTAEQDKEQARDLLVRLKSSLGDAWQDEWLAGGLPGVPRPLLPLTLGDEPEAAMRQMAEQAQQEIERLRQESPEAYRQLEGNALM